MSIRLKVRKGDIVTVISGKDKGKSGKVLAVYPENAKVLVEKINFVKRHTKPSQKMPQGGIHEKEAALQISKVMVLDSHSGKPSRIGRKMLADGKLVRFFKKSGEMIEQTKA
jgi:large subunit ribosomal protein L24